MKSKWSATWSRMSSNQRRSFVVVACLAALFCVGWVLFLAAQDARDRGLVFLGLMVVALVVAIVSFVVISRRARPPR